MPKIYFLTAKTNELNPAFATFLTVTFAIEEQQSIFAPPISKRSVRLGVRTPDFHSGNTGSIPVRTTTLQSKIIKTAQFERKGGFCFFKPTKTYIKSHYSGERFGE